MEKPLYIDIWGKVQRKNAQNQCRLGLSGLASFQLDETQIHKTAYHLSTNLHLGRGSEGSWYTLFIPVLNNNEVVKIRISDHLSTEDEWRQHEITGLPNRRYSIVIYNRHSMYIQHKKKQHYIDWQKYELDGIDVYELCVHCNYVPTCWRYLYYVIKEIYLGGRPEETNIPHMKDSEYKRDFEVSKEWNCTMDKPINQKQDDYLENKTDKNESKNMTKKNTIRLTESELKNIINDSIKNIISELDYKTYINAYKKAEKNGDARAKKFFDAASDEFNKQYGFDDEEGIFYMDDFEHSDGEHSATWWHFPNGNRQYSPDNVHDFDKLSRPAKLRQKRKDLPQRVKQGEREYANYIKGNYEYTKDKGWDFKR